MAETPNPVALPTVPLESADTSGVPHIVVLGAGFAGLQAARKLARAPVDITIIDRRNHHVFQPLLYQVASAALDPSDIAYPIRSIFRGQHNVRRIVLAEVESIETDGAQILCKGIDPIPYDRLVVATGATHSYFGNDAWAAHAPGLKSVEDALEIRRRVLRAFENAELHPEEAKEHLTFVVVGAGPTGVELAGALIEIAVDALAREFDVIDPSSARVVLVEGADRVLPPYPAKLSASARRQLESLGVEVRTGVQAQHIDERGVRLSDGTEITARTVLWAAGVKASPLAASLGAPLDRSGRVRVEPDLSVPGHPEIFVAGDLAAVTSGGAPVPGVAPAAIQAGKHVAAQIRADLGGRPRSAFRYVDKGSLATIGKARAVADLGWLKFSGFTAWVAWMFIHILFLVGFRNRLFVVLSWAWSYVTFRRGARLITEPDSPRPDATAGTR